MKRLNIGIITLSASDNCGSLLQAYALQEVIKNKMNCDVEIINFVPSESKKVYSLFSVDFYKHPKKTLFTCLHLMSIIRQKKGYRDFRNKFLNLTNEIYVDNDDLKGLDDKYDVIITGSDQVWNINMTDFNEAYYLPWVKNAKKIAYATSLGSTIVLNQEQAKRIENMLKDFHAISIREQTGVNTLNDLSPIPIVMTSDPTLLLNNEEWDKIVGDRLVDDEYIFYYSWAYPDENMNRLVQKFATDHNVKVYVINSSRWYKYRPSKFGFELYPESGPIKFLNLMKYAKYVFVQSFHGAVFANIFKKRFFFLNEKADGEIDFRTKNIIGLLHEEGQIVHDMSDFEMALNSELTYESKELDDLINSSLRFIEKSIS